jgi:peroxiredoxin
MSACRHAANQYQHYLATNHKYRRMKYLLFVSAFLLLFSLAKAQQVPKGLNVNDAAPAFVAKDQHGRKISLAEEMKKGPVVLVFYRGQWCPYCNKQLKKLEDSISFITARGAELIAVSPEKPENIEKTISKTKATYSVLFDDGLNIMKNFDVAYAVDTATVAKYKKYGIDFSKVNGANGAVLPVPAVFVISKEGKIVFRHFDPDYRNRASVKDILDHL